VGEKRVEGEERLSSVGASSERPWGLGGVRVVGIMGGVDAGEAGGRLKKSPTDGLHLSAGERRGHTSSGFCSGGPWVASRPRPECLPEALFHFYFVFLFFFPISYLKIFIAYFDSKMIQTF
jgi:hypothetical protein